MMRADFAFLTQLEGKETQISKMPSSILPREPVLQPQDAFFIHAAHGHDEKPEEYRKLPSLTRYVIRDQDSRFVTMYKSARDRFEAKPSPAALLMLVTSRRR
jgi:hypothetical protein